MGGQNDSGEQRAGRRKTLQAQKPTRKRGRLVSEEDKRRGEDLRVEGHCHRTRTRGTNDKGGTPHLRSKRGMGGAQRPLYSSKATGTTAQPSCRPTALATPTQTRHQRSAQPDRPEPGWRERYARKSFRRRTEEEGPHPPVVSPTTGANQTHARWHRSRYCPTFC